MAETITRIRPDLYETRTDNPFPGLTTHAYLWTSPGANVLFYSPATEADFDVITDLGGVDHHYLSHQDEAGPMLAVIAERFGSRLHAPKPELAEIGKHRDVDVPVAGRHVDDNGIEIIPTPGHSVGSTCYLVPGVDGQSYLFTGDTIFTGDDGQWGTYLPQGDSDPAAAAESLELLATLEPDVVISSAFGGSAVHDMSGGQWRDAIRQALGTVPSTPDAPQ